MMWLCLVLSMLLSSCTTSRSVMLTWDVNTEPDVAGYTIYCGDQPKIYRVQLQVGRVTAHPAPQLTPGTHYCAVTARSNAGMESEFSNEILVVVPR